MVKISKNMLLNGKEETKTVELESMNNVEVDIRYLSQKEINKYEAMKLESMEDYQIKESIKGRRNSNQENTGKINLMKTTEDNQKANAYLVSISTVLEKGEKLTELDALSLQTTVFNELLNHIKEINGLDEDLDDEELEKAVKNFHKKE